MCLSMLSEEEDAKLVRLYDALTDVVFDKELYAHCVDAKCWLRKNPVIEFEQKLKNGEFDGWVDDDIALSRMEAEEYSKTFWHDEPWIGDDYVGGITILIKLAPDMMHAIEGMRVMSVLKEKSEAWDGHRTMDIGADDECFEKEEMIYDEK